MERGGTGSAKRKRTRKGQSTEPQVAFFDFRVSRVRALAATCFPSIPGPARTSSAFTPRRTAKSSGGEYANREGRTGHEKLTSWPSSAYCSSPYSSSRSSTPASWYCWYSAMRSCMLDSASVNLCVKTDRSKGQQSLRPESHKPMTSVG